jgi:hypothetical protein
MMSDDAGRSWSASLERLEQLERSWNTEGGFQFSPVHSIKTCLGLKLFARLPCQMSWKKLNQIEPA